MPPVGRMLRAPRGVPAWSVRAGIPLLMASWVMVGPAVSPVAAAGSTITVNTIASSIADDGTCSFEEAILAANSNTASGAMPGECAAGSGADTIVFGFTNATVDAYGGLSSIEGDLTVNGGGSVTLDLGGLGHIAKGSGTVVLKGLAITNGSNGGVWNQAPGSLLVTDSLITGTTAGSGIYNAGTLTVQRTTISGNTSFAGGFGGGLWNDAAASATVVDSVIDGNHATVGGGVYSQGPMVIRGTTVSANTTGLDGGGLYTGSTASITASTFSGNTSGNVGGAISNVGDLAITNTTLSDNHAVAGGGIYTSGTLTATNDTITRNVSSSLWAGLYNASALTTVRNTIIAGNSTTDFGGPALAAASGHNQIGPLPGGVALATWLDGSGLRDNGGRTETIALVNSSINPFATGGDPAVCAVAPVGAADQRGVKRPVGTCSIGAVQLERSAPIAGTPTVGIASGASLAGTAIRAQVSWSGKDNVGGSGIDHFQIARSVNGGAWVIVLTTLPSVPPALSPIGAALVSGVDGPALPLGKSYRYRVRAFDHDGNASGWVAGTIFTPRLTQQTSAAVHFSGSWATSSGTAFSGGSVKAAKTAGASATYTATGRSFAFVSTLASNRGKARIYVNGVLKATVDLVSMTNRLRVQVWSIRFSTSASRTIKIVVVGTVGRPRVDIDAFAVLN